MCSDTIDNGAKIVMHYGFSTSLSVAKYTTGISGKIHQYHEWGIWHDAILNERPEVWLVCILFQRGGAPRPWKKYRRRKRNVSKFILYIQYDIVEFELAGHVNTGDIKIEA